MSHDYDETRRIMRAYPRRPNQKANVVREGATKLKPSNRGRKRAAQPRKAHPYEPEPDIRLFDIQAKTHVAHGTTKHAPCKLVVRYAGEKKQWGVYYGKRPKPQMFNSKEAAERFQKECKKAHGIKGLSTMAKSKKKPSKRKKASVAARKAKGSNCVYTPKGKLFNCFAEKASAQAVVKGMNKRSPGWTIKTSGR